MFSITLLIFILLNVIWLFGFAKKFREREMGKMLRKPMNGLAVGLFYLVYAVGLICFVILPMAGSEGGLMAFLRGAGFGFVAYSTYALTNLAFLETWSLRLTVIDILWGSFATGVTVLIVVWIL